MEGVHLLQPARCAAAGLLRPARLVVHAPPTPSGAPSKSHRTAFFWAIGLTCGIILENVYVQLIFDPGSIPPRHVGPRRAQPPMENLLFICYGLAVLRGASVSLQLRARELPEGDDRFARGVHRPSAAFV